MADDKIESIVQSSPVDVSSRDIQHLREFVLAAIRREFELLREQIAHNREIADERDAHHVHEHQIMERAVAVAKAETDLRLEAMNELRTQITQERSVYLPREVHEAANAELQKWKEAVNLALTTFLTISNYDREHKTLEERVGVIESFTSNYQGRLWMLGAVLTGVVVLVNLAIKFWK